jgi:hypothetical protein
MQYNQQLTSGSNFEQRMNRSAVCDDMEISAEVKRYYHSPRE